MAKNDGKNKHNDQSIEYDDRQCFKYKKNFLCSFISEKNLPGVYVNVVEFVDWITNTITRG